jgi:hypothetical protein
LGVEADASSGERLGLCVDHRQLAVAQAFGTSQVTQLPGYKSAHRRSPEIRENSVFFLLRLGVQICS